MVKHILVNSNIDQGKVSPIIDKVVFRKFSDGEIIALLPDNEANFGKVDSYLHIGQHGEADTGITHDTKLAKPEEYADLLEELKSIGYNPKVYKKLQYGWLNWQ